VNPRETLKAVLSCGGFFAESHTVKAWLAREVLLQRSPAVAEAVEGALEWNQVLASPKATTRLAALVDFDMAPLEDRRLHFMVDGSVFPVAYAAAEELRKRHGLNALVARHCDRALNRLGNLGHAFTVHQAFVELAERLQAEHGDDEELHGLAAERYAELVASQLSTVDHAKADVPVETNGDAPREIEGVIDRALRWPGYFGHNLISMGVLFRVRERLDDARWAYAWARLDEMAHLVEGPSWAFEITEEGKGDLDAALTTLLTAGPKEAHTLTLARALVDLQAAEPALAPRLVAVAERFAAWDPNRSASGERTDS
jgi:hypothetical protein